MKEAKLAPVLAAMDATKAQAVTVELAARRAPTVQSLLSRSPPKSRLFTAT
jgi:flagellar motility protein MotE (MotC chaperone)